MQSATRSHITPCTLHRTTGHNIQNTIILFATVFTNAKHWTQFLSKESSPYHPAFMFKIHFNIILSRKPGCPTRSLPYTLLSPIEIFSFRKRSSWRWCAASLAFNGYQGLFPGSKSPGSGAAHSPPPSTAATVYTHIFTPPICLLGVVFH